MKFTQICLLLQLVSFLAIGPAYSAEDEFSIFEDVEKATSPSPTTPKKSEPVLTLEELKAAVRKEPKRIDLIQKLAVQLDANGETDKATKLLWKYIDKIDDEHLMILAELELKMKRFDQSTRVATLISGKNPKNSEAWTLLGKSQKLQGLHQEALESFKQAITVNPKNAAPYWELVKHYESKNNLYEVRILLQDLIEAKGKDLDATLKICEVNYKDEAFEAAVQSCKEALLKSPQSADSSVYLGLSLKAVGQDAAAISQLKKAANKFKASELAQFHYAEHLQKEKNHLEAVKYFKSAVAADEKSARAWIGLGVESFEIQKYEDALVAFKKGCKLQRFEAATQIRKAILQLRSTKEIDMTRKYEQAAESCQFQ